MASLPPFQQLQFQQIPGAPSWFAGFLTALNPFLQSVYSALNKNLNGDNIPYQFQTLTLNVPSTGYAVQSFTWTTPARPKLCLLAQCVQMTGTVTANTTSAIALNQWTAQGSKISLDSMAGLSPGQTYQLTFFVL